MCNTICTTCGFVNDVMFAHNGLYVKRRWQYQRERHAAASCDKFPTCSAWDATLFGILRQQTGHWGQSVVYYCLVTLATSHV